MATSINYKNAFFQISNTYRDNGDYLSGIAANGAGQNFDKGYQTRVSFEYKKFTLNELLNLNFSIHISYSLFKMFLKVARQATQSNTFSGHSFIFGNV